MVTVAEASRPVFAKTVRSFATASERFQLWPQLDSNVDVGASLRAL